MLGHLFNLLGRSCALIPAALGSNWLGLISPIFIALIGEGIGTWLFGIQAMKANWKKATGIGLAAIGAFYTVVFIGCIFTTTYKDHADLVFKNQQLHEVVNKDQASEERAIQIVRQPLESQLSALRETCAVKDGINRTLEKQNRDQQSTITGCLTQAIKMVTPEMPRVTILTHASWPNNRIDPESVKHEQKMSATEVLVLVNRVVSCPCDLSVTIDQPFLLPPDFFVPGASMMTSVMARVVASNIATIHFDTPSLSPTRPLMITVYSKKNLQGVQVDGIR